MAGAPHAHNIMHEQLQRNGLPYDSEVHSRHAHANEVVWCARLKARGCNCHHTMHAYGTMLMLAAQVLCLFCNSVLHQHHTAPRPLQVPVWGSSSSMTG